MFQLCTSDFRPSHARAPQQLNNHCITRLGDSRSHCQIIIKRDCGLRARSFNSKRHVIPPSHAVVSPCIKPLSKPTQSTSLLSPARCCGTLFQPLLCVHRSWFRKQCEKTVQMSDVFGGCFLSEASEPPVEVKLVE